MKHNNYNDYDTMDIMEEYDKDDTTSEFEDNKTNTDYESEDLEEPQIEKKRADTSGLSVETISIFGNTALDSAVRELKRICNRLGYPMFITICTQPADAKSSYVNDFITPKALNIPVKPDMIAEHIKLINGFHTVSNELDVIDTALL